LRRTVAVHDAVLQSALCPLLSDLPGGKQVADELCEGCQERAKLLHRFEEIIRNVPPNNVYRTSGEEVEQILSDLEESLRQHVEQETNEVGAVLASCATSTDPDIVSARMAIVAQKAPTRVHAGSGQSHSPWLRSLYRLKDRFQDWTEAHHGWLDPASRHSSPREEQVSMLKYQANEAPPSIKELLAGYDATVESIISELDRARGSREKASAAHRLVAAMALHDSVLGGVLCPLLDSLPEGKALAAKLREGCLRRAELQQEWNKLTKAVPLEDLYVSKADEASSIIESLKESFRKHEGEETLDVSSLLANLPGSSYRTKESPFEDILWPWYSEGPSALALHMALWAEGSPTRVHPLLVKHPRSRSLRTFYHYLDHLQDRWGDSMLGRWFFPELPSQPYASGKDSSGKERASEESNQQGDQSARKATSKESNP